MTNDNPLKNTRIEFHILQSFPVTCLNRDDVGAPKTAVVGDTTRARVSSQCWKRQVRLTMREFGGKFGIRTKFISRLIEDACLNEGATEEQAKACAQKIGHVFIKEQVKGNVGKKKKTVDEEIADEDGVIENDQDNDTLIFLSPKEIQLITLALKETGFDPNALIKQKDQKKQAKELADLLRSKLELKVDDVMQTDALDIALFGRMVAKAASMNVEAAASFSHAISTHKISNEVEFFTALDDRPDLSDKPGSAHMGSLEFNSATYYRYISLDLGQLNATLKGIALPEAIEAFTKALFIAIPSARQTTQSGASPWEFAKIFVRKGQRLQVPFETAIRAESLENGGFLKPSIEALRNYLITKEEQFGSLFGKKAEYTFGDGEKFSIDDLVAALKQQVAEISK